MTSTMPTKTLWWHAYLAEAPEFGRCVFVGGESPIDPETLAAEGRLSVDLPDGLLGSGPLTARYVRSWDHEPTEQEKAAAMPFLADDDEGFDSGDFDEPCDMCDGGWVDDPMGLGGPRPCTYCGGAG